MCKECEQHLPKFLEALKKNDPQFFEAVTKVSKVEGGALSEKTKTLITLAIDAVLGKDEGVKSLAKKARALGATKEEIADVVRVVFISAGYPGLSSAAKVFEIEP